MLKEVFFKVSFLNSAFFSTLDLFRSFISLFLCIYLTFINLYHADYLKYACAEHTICGMQLVSWSNKEN